MEMFKKLLVGYEIKLYLMEDGQLLITTKDHPELVRLDQTQDVTVEIGLQDVPRANVTFIVGDIEELPVELHAQFLEYKKLPMDKIEQLTRKEVAQELGKQKKS